MAGDKKISHFNALYHPAAKHPRQAMFLCAGFGFMASALYYLSQDWLLTLALLAALAFSLMPFFIPVYYDFDAEGLTLRRLHKRTTILWKDYATFSYRRGGVVLRGPSSGEGKAPVSKPVFLPMDEDLWNECRDILASRWCQEAEGGKGGKGGPEGPKGDKNSSPQGQ